jgi:hypothetical protein
MTELVGTFQNYPEPDKCAECGSEHLHKIVSVPGKALVPFSSMEDNIEAEKNKSWLESPQIQDEIMSGERTMTVPKGMPSRLMPQLR